MGIDSFWYRLFLLLHILTAIVGFGAVLLNGVYASRARTRPPAEGLAVMEVNTYVSLKVGEKFILAVPILGFGVLGLSDEVWKFSQTWVWLSLVIYLVALAVSFGLLQPKVKRLLALQREIVAAGPPQGLPPQGLPPQAAEMATLGKQIGPISGILHLALVVILVLMIWKPGV